MRALVHIIKICKKRWNMTRKFRGKLGKFLWRQWQHFFSMSWVISHAWVVLAIFLGLAIFYFHHCMLANLTYFRTVGQGHVIISRFEIKRFNYIPFFETRSFGYIPTISREPVTQIWISKEFWGFFVNISWMAFQLWINDITWKKKFPLFLVFILWKWKSSN